MIDITSQKDLVVLAADKDIEFAIRGVLSHPEKMPIRPVCYDIRTHPQRDPGCRKTAHQFLRAYANQYRFALVVFDKHGCGQDVDARESIESEVEQRLVASGWPGRAAAVCIDPELEIWVWSDSPLLDETIGWRGRDPDLRTWLAASGFVGTKGAKPGRPKECLAEALRIATRPKSPMLFADLAGKVSYKRCTDPSFAKLVRVLMQWFPGE